MVYGAAKYRALQHTEEALTKALKQNPYPRFLGRSLGTLSPSAPLDLAGSSKCDLSQGLRTSTDPDTLQSKKPRAYCCALPNCPMCAKERP